MRTTLTLEPDVEQGLRELARLRNEPFKRIVNELLRSALTKDSPSKKKKVAIKPHAGGFRPGVDVLKLNQLADELEVEDFGKKAAGSK